MASVFRGFLTFCFFCRPERLATRAPPDELNNLTCDIESEGAVLCFQIFAVFDRSDAAAVPDADVFAADDLGFDILQLDIVALDRADARAAGARAEDAEERRRVLLQHADGSADDGTDVYRGVHRDLDCLRVQKSADLHRAA